ERLCRLTVEEYGSGQPGLSVAGILWEMTDQEIADTFTPILHDLLQEGREICSHFIVPEPVKSSAPVRGLTRKKIMKAVKNSGTTCSRCEYENDDAIKLEQLDKTLQEMEFESEDRESPRRQSGDAIRERYIELRSEERRLDELEAEANIN
ncbi:MAG: hypothetical protein Q8P59_14695, partial [Dehalococcoidia bacterium]|nr:hypothetical protein [Dehalococcoidia bacterium]